jgi:uncharacterized OB-fold protein
MAGYGVAERKAARETKAHAYLCGSCGARVYEHEALCPACEDDVFFSSVCVQVENEKFESGESQ